MSDAPDFAFVIAAQQRGFIRVAGVDEVGRGPLAGPVTAAAVILDPARIPAGLGDSKTLTAPVREELAAEIHQVAEVAIAHASVTEIDEINILQASHLAMCRAIEALGADFAVVDGPHLPRDLPCLGEAVVKGDGRCLAVAAASIVAKVARDALMVDLAQQHPGYGWETNMGYGSKRHISALQDLGPTPHHRRSFAPVHNILCREETVTS
ncbi:ribonuclease HII [Histidinibacterium aquaticum]|uniref:Ribonuclease HII n=1 Tax=Histidinibacterium aquaticum TaxID=2613962 RepID=A0A5J5GD67_9RHOB|nr:ribonuclease HII [Histidinibacterium aquaticum]KAA9005967.1 ribonuclease HII [Histidinibacterium aquaticum]